MRAQGVARRVGSRRRAVQLISYALPAERAFACSPGQSAPSRRRNFGRAGAGRLRMGLIVVARVPESDTTFAIPANCRRRSEGR